MMIKPNCPLVDYPFFDLARDIRALCIKLALLACITLAVQPAVYAQQPKPKTTALKTLGIEQWLNKPAPVFHGYSILQKSTFELSKKTGRVTLLAFWAFDCASCVSRLSELRANAAGWANKPFDLVIVSTDKTADAVNTYTSYLDITQKNSAKTVEGIHFMWRLHPKHQDGFGPMLFDLNTAIDPNAVRIFLIDKQGIIKKIYTESLKPNDWDDVAELVL